MSTPRGYAVADGLLAGAYPDSAAAVAALEASGVSLFVDLTHPSDPLGRYDFWLGSARRVGYPIPDMGTPTAGLVIRILDDIDSELRTGETVYVHCLGGVGRTGAVIGCWLARHGLHAGDPVERVRELRAAIAGTRPSPETPGQTALVRGWKAGR